MRNLYKSALFAATILSGASASWATTAGGGDGPPDNAGLMPVSSGQIITPTAATNAVYQTLNPMLASYPN